MNLHTSGFMQFQTAEKSSYRVTPAQRQSAQDESGGRTAVVHDES